MSLVILYYMMQIIDPSSFILGFFWGGGIFACNAKAGGELQPQIIRSVFSHLRAPTVVLLVVCNIK